MAMNIKKVVVGGLVAGVILNVVDFISNYVLGARMRAEAEAFKQGISDQMMAGNAVISYVIMDLVLGIALVFTYAAVRPRFGPGPRTAVYVALLFWLLGLIFNSGYRQMGMMSAGLWWTFAIIWLVSFSIASWAGAAIYSEEGAV
jgi:hypothetical protein